MSKASNARKQRLARKPQGRRPRSFRWRRYLKDRHDWASYDGDPRTIRMAMDRALWDGVADLDRAMRVQLWCNR